MKRRLIYAFLLDIRIILSAIIALSSAQFTDAEYRRIITISGGRLDRAVGGAQYSTRSCIDARPSI